MFRGQEHSVSARWLGCLGARKAESIHAKSKVTSCANCKLLRRCRANDRDGLTNSYMLLLVRVCCSCNTFGTMKGLQVQKTRSLSCFTAGGGREAQIAYKRRKYISERTRNSEVVQCQQGFRIHSTPVR